jgi:hypothetical protein
VLSPDHEDDPDDGPPPLELWETAFVDALRSRVAELDWFSELAPDDWLAGMQDEDGPEGRCLAFLDLLPPGGSVFTAGVFFNGEVTTAGRMESQSMVLMRDSLVLSPRLLGGTMQEQAMQAADWLWWVRNRPIRRRSWSDTAHEWSFADDRSGFTASGGRADRSGALISDIVVPDERDSGGSA